MSCATPGCGMCERARLRAELAEAREQVAAVQRAHERMRLRAENAEMLLRRISARIADGIDSIDGGES